MNIWFFHHLHAFRLATGRLSAAPLVSLLSIAVIGIAFSLPAGVYVLLENLEALSGQVSATPQLTVFLALDANEKTTAEVESVLKGHRHVASFRYVPRDSALEEFKRETGLADVMEGLERNPLPDAFIINAPGVSPEALNELGEELQKMPQVAHVHLDSAWAKRLEALLGLGRLGVLLLTSLLSFSLVAVAFNMIRLQILTMKDEIEVSKLIGATSDFIRRPFLYFGAIQGAIGGAAAWLIIFFGIHLTDSQIRQLMRLYEVDFRLDHLSLGDSLSLLLFSAWLGWMGAWLSVANHLWQAES